MEGIESAANSGQMEMYLREVVYDVIKVELEKAFAKHTEVMAQMLKHTEELPTVKCEDKQANACDGAKKSTSAMQDIAAETQGFGDETTDDDLVELGDQKQDSRSVFEVLSEYMPLCRPLLSCLQFVNDNMGVHQATFCGDPISKFVESYSFATCINVIIGLNCIFMWLGADEEIDQPEDRSDLMKYGEFCFMVAYSIEFVLKLVRYRWEYFIGPEWKYNWLDCFLLALSYFFEFSGTGGNLGFLRTIRILKLAKALRVLRLVAMFKSLRAILVSLINTIGTLGWSILMLGVIHFLFGLVVVLRIAQWLTSQRESGEPVDPEEYEALMLWFGSVFTSMRSLYGTHSGGEGWQTLYSVLRPVGWIEQAFMLFFVFFSQIAILNIILGIFVDDAMKSMECSKEEATFEHEEAQMEIADNIRSLCHEANTAGSGRLSRQEFRAAVSKGQFRSYLDLVGLSAHNLPGFFNALSKESEDGLVDIETFVKSCMRLRGQASAYDMQVVLAQMNGIGRRDF
jgi:hypothetical protein